MPDRTWAAREIIGIVSWVDATSATLLFVVASRPSAPGMIWKLCPEAATRPICPLMTATTVGEWVAGRGMNSA